MKRKIPDSNCRFWVPILFFLSLASGCGPHLPDGMPPLQPLSLMVTQEGEPLSGASVSLFSTDNSHSWTSGGMTSPDGTLNVFTHGKFNGIPMGKYKVTVDCVASDLPAPKDATMEELDAHNRKHPAFRIVPMSYTDKNTTPLEIEVAKGKNRQTINIPEKVKLSLGGPP